MAKNKLAKYIMYEPDKAYLDKIKGMTPKSIQEQRAKGNYYDGKYMFHLDDTILPGGFYTDCRYETPGRTQWRDRAVAGR